MSIFKKIVAKLTGMESWPPKPKVPKAETGGQAFQRKYGSEQSALAEERRQASLRRMAERGQRQESLDVTKELEELGKKNGKNGEKWDDVP